MSLRNIKETFSKIIKNSPESSFFVYFEEELKTNVSTFQSYFDALFAKKLLYSFSVKTQPNYRLVRFFKAQGFHFDVSSLSELDYALRMGVSASKISLEGVGVDHLAIDKALEENIGFIHFDSLEMYDYFHQKKSPTCTIKTSVRLNLSHDQSKIGFSKEELSAIQGTIKVDGLHVYLGRETFSLETLKKLLAEVKDLFKNLKCFSANPILFLGPGVPNLRLFSQVLEKGKIDFPYEVRIESGRALCSSAGAYGVQVLSVKESSLKQKIITVDGGLQHLGSPWVTLKGGLLDVNPLFFDSLGVEKFSQDSTEVESLVYGSLCLWHDCLHPRLRIPRDLKRNDWIVVSHMGAYGLTAGVPLFIGEKLPLEYYDDTSSLADVTHTRFQLYSRGF